MGINQKKLRQHYRNICRSVTSQGNRFTAIISRCFCLYSNQRTRIYNCFFATLKYLLTVLLAVFCFVAFPVVHKAQGQSTSQIPDTRFTSPSIVSGPAAIPLNPANIAAPTHQQSHQIMLGGFAAGSNSGYLLSEFPENFTSIYDDWFVIDTSDNLLSQPTLTTVESYNQYNFNYYDATLAAYTNRTSNISWGLSLRKRSYNTSYQSVDQEVGNSDNIKSHDVRQRLTTLYEMNFGFATPLEMVSGWRSGLNTVYLGLNPKFLVSGMHFDGHYRSEYSEDISGRWEHHKQVSATANGDLHEVLRQTTAQNGNMSEAMDANTGRFSLSEPTGAGAGVDAGITWIIALDDDTALVPGRQGSLEKNIRFSFAITDIGAVRHNDNLNNYKIERTQLQSSTPVSTPPRFSGKAGEFSKFLSSGEREIASDFNEKLDQTETDQWTQLPTAMHLAGSYHYNNFMVGLDTSYQINPVHFFDKGWYNRISSEASLFGLMPLRASLLMDPEFRPSYSLGFGFDFDVINLGVETRLETTDNGDWTVQEVGAGNLTIRF